eukprot:Mrub_13664.p1 GENE.Mrub_13664~~Mrub_13664.p1  ORF type:complete len:136 (+),score=22.32 Mrub_13664:49-408(+)
MSKDNYKDHYFIPEPLFTEEELDELIESMQETKTQKADKELYDRIKKYKSEKKKNSILNERNRRFSFGNLDTSYNEENTIINSLFVDNISANNHSEIQDNEKIFDPENSDIENSTTNDN